MFEGSIEENQLPGCTFTEQEDVVDGIYDDSWGCCFASVITQMGSLVHISSLNGSWDSSLDVTGTFENNRIKILGRTGTLMGMVIRWSNGAAWTRRGRCPVEVEAMYRRGSVLPEQVWVLPAVCPRGWSTHDIELAPPRQEECFAALLYGDKPEFFVYACVLGYCLRSYSFGPDRVLMCGPGAICADPAMRASLRSAGWDYLLPVMLISAPHLDKSKTKRHASVFTKLHALCLPYDRVLLLDLDLLPRRETNLQKLFAVPAPAGKYSCSQYSGPEPPHGDLIACELRECDNWSPNAGVLRLDPLPTRKEREMQLVQIVNELNDGDHIPTYLPEQYYLARRFDAWRHIDHVWNWELGFERTVPTHSVTLHEAVAESIEHGWTSFFPEVDIHSSCLIAMVLRDVRVWHYSGTDDTQPWMFLDCVNATAVKFFAAHVWFAARDPGGVLATALAEWRETLDELMANTREPCALSSAVKDLRARAARCRCRYNEWCACVCDACGEERYSVQRVPDHLVWVLGIPRFHWACAECIIKRLQMQEYKVTAASLAELRKRSRSRSPRVL